LTDKYFLKTPGAEAPRLGFFFSYQLILNPLFIRVIIP